MSTDLPPPPPPPPPPKKVGAPRPGGARVFVFLVGIDNYVHLRNSDLSGCVEDVLGIESFLRWRYRVGSGEDIRIEDGLTHRAYPFSTEAKGWDSLEVMTLTNTGATYQNVVTHFRAFLRQALRGDIVWVHFSGLGTTLRSNMPRVIAGVEDWALLCNDARLDGSTAKAMLTDKELAVLLNEVATPFSTPHIAVTLDTWFSATRARNDLEGEASRFFRLSRRVDRGTPPTRNYFDEIEDLDGISAPLPNPSHLILNAKPGADSATAVAENEAGGLFTLQMLNVLIDKKAEISYADLAERTEAVLNNLEEGNYEVELRPQGNISTQIGFLLSGVGEELEGYPVINSVGGWTIAVGLIHGLPSSIEFAGQAMREDDVVVDIYSYEDDTKVATARIASIGTYSSELSEVTNVSREAALDDDAYYGKLSYFPVAPLFVRVTDSEEESWATSIGQTYPKIAALNIQFIDAGSSDTAYLEISVDATGIQMSSAADVQPAFQKHYARDNEKGLVDDLIKIANWKRLSDLQSPDDASLADIELNIQANGRLNTLSPSSEEEVAGGKEVTLRLNAFESIQTQFNDRKFYLRPRVAIPDAVAAARNGTVYVYLFELWSWHEISARSGQRTVRLDGETIDLPYTGFGWGLDGNEDRDTVQLKLIVSTQELDYLELLQEGTKASAPQEYYSSGSGVQRQTASADWWYTTTLTLHVERDDNPVEGTAHDPRPGFLDDAGLNNPAIAINKRHAFVIGINQYPGLDADLMTARSDAEEVAKRLKVIQGYDNVLLMQDAGKEQITALLNWLGDAERDPNGLAIDDIEFNITRPSYHSRIGWLETAPSEEEAELSLVTRKPGEDQRVTHLHLVKERECLIEADDAVVFYFAGHGYPGDVDASISGQLVPTDARKGRSSSSGLIEMDFLYQQLFEINSKHFLLILDCCYAGQFRFANRNRSIASSFLMPMHRGRLQQYLRRAAWQVLVSSGPDETALDSAELASIRDHSPFAHTLIRALEGDADVVNSDGPRGRRTGDGVITASELDIFVSNQVFDIVSDIQLQQPDLFPMEKDRGGEFLFFTPDFSFENLAQRVHVPPYKGLEAYQLADRHRFFGRERPIAEIRQQLEKLARAKEAASDAELTPFDKA